MACSSRKYFDQGKTMNLLTVDTNAIFGLVMMGTFLMSSPIMIVVSIVLITLEIKWIGLVTPLVFIIGAYL
jgi:hypothetical protein